MHWVKTPRSACTVAWEQVDSYNDVSLHKPVRYSELHSKFLAVSVSMHSKRRSRAFQLFVLFSVMVFFGLLYFTPSGPPRMVNLAPRASKEILLDQNATLGSAEEVVMASKAPKASVPDTINNLPIHSVLYYNVSGLNSNRSVFVVPRRAYFDNRTLRGKPRNMVVIVAEVHDKALKSIVACEINRERTTSVNIVKEGTFTGWVRAHIKECTHRVVVVECLGFATKSIVNGSSTNIIYMKEGEDHYSRVETEKPLLIRSEAQYVVPNKGKGSIFACSMLFGNPETLDDWLRYQKTLGVDFVHFSVDISFAVNASTNYPFLAESLHSGFAAMEVWNDIVGNRMFYNGQIVKYQDCVYRYLGIYDYGIFIDVDDFFNPMLPNHKNIHYYFNRFFSKDKVGSVCLVWPQMQCAPVKELHKTLTDGNLTRILSGYDVKHRPTRKCAHRLSVTVLVKIHEVEKSFPGFSEAKLNDHLAYVAHNHVGQKECKTTNKT